MNPLDDNGHWLDEALSAPLLAVPDDFTARVMAALPPRAPAPAPRGRGRQLRQVLQALVWALCGALGAAEVLLFALGLWTVSTAALS